MFECVVFMLINYELGRKQLARDIGERNNSHISKWDLRHESHATE